MSKGLKVIMPEVCFYHKPFPFFSEKPERLESLRGVFNHLGIYPDKKNFFDENVCYLAHDINYVAEVKRTSSVNFVSAAIKNITSPHLQWYNRVYNWTYLASVASLNAGCQAVDHVIKNKSRAFCAIRPPGHHAHSAYGEGFCVFNNAATAALHAIKNYGAKRVLIVDFDRHHGNGTENIVLEKGEGKIFLASSFEIGGHDYATKNSGENILHIPLEPRSNFVAVEKAYKKLVEWADKIKPDLVIISAGFDMHEDDPLTSMKLLPEDYFTLTKMITGISEKHCEGKVISLLEGGYNLKALPECVHFHLKALLD